MSAMAYLVELGLGHHFSTIPPDNIFASAKIGFIIQFFHLFGITLAKSSALFFCQRIFDIAGSRVRYAVWITHALNGMSILYSRFFDTYR